MKHDQDDLEKSAERELGAGGGISFRGFNFNSFSSARTTGDKLRQQVAYQIYENNGRNKHACGYWIFEGLATGVSLSFEVGRHLQESSWAENYT